MLQQPAVSGRILIVDDDERQRKAMVAMLSDCDFDIQLASDGQEALERLTAFNASAVNDASPGSFCRRLLKWELMPRFPEVSGRILIVDDDERQRKAMVDDEY